MKTHESYYAVFETNEIGSIEISFPDIENAVTFVEINDKSVETVMSEAISMAEDVLAATLAFEKNFPKNSSFQTIKEKYPSSFILAVQVNTEIMERYKSNLKETSNSEIFKVLFKEIKIGNSQHYKIKEIKTPPLSEYKMFFDSNRRYPILRDGKLIHMNSKKSYLLSDENLILSRDEVNKIVIAVIVLNLQYKIWKKISIIDDFVVK